MGLILYTGFFSLIFFSLSSVPQTSVYPGIIYLTTSSPLAPPKHNTVYLFIETYTPSNGGHESSSQGGNRAWGFCCKRLTEVTLSGEEEWQSRTGQGKLLSKDVGSAVAQVRSEPRGGLQSLNCSSVSIPPPARGLFPWVALCRRWQLWTVSQW